MKLLSVLLIVFNTITAKSDLLAATFHISPTGNDANPGTAELPFLTVQKGVDTAQPGDIVRVGPGTYSQDVITARSGTSNAPIVLDGQAVAVVRSFNLRHQYITLQNFSIKGRTNYYSSLLLFNRGAHHCVVSNNMLDCDFVTNVFPVSWYTPSTKPFGEDAGSHNLFVNNTITKGMAMPMMTIYGNGNIIQGNRLVDGNMVDWFRLWGRSNYIVANLCSNNFYSSAGNHPDFIQTFGDNGYGSCGQVIEGNLIIKGEAMQLNMLTADRMPDEICDWTFRNNIFVDVASAGSVLIQRAVYYNNVFFRCNTTNGGHAILFRSRIYGTNGTDYAHGGRVFNNIFLDCGDSRTKVGWYYFATNLLDVAADYNYVGKLGYKPVMVDPQQRAIGNPGGWDYMCMSWWEPHGINGGDPLFVDESNLELRLKEMSPLIGAALPLNQLFTTDMRGTTRGAEWDIGPLEFRIDQTIFRPVPPTKLRMP